MSVDPSSRVSPRGRTRALILKALMQHGPVGQQDLVRHTALNQATISRVLAELRAERLVVAVDWAARIAGPGRRPTRFDLDSPRTVVLGVQFGLWRANLGLVDLRGQLLADVAVDHGGSSASALDRVVGAARTLVERSMPPDGRLLGVGVGVAGVLDAEAGLVRIGVEEHQPPVPLWARLTETFEVPVFLDNNVHAMALAEAWYGVGLSARSVALLFVGHAIRLGLVSEGRVYHGDGPWDGMLGHAVFDPDGPPCACGQRGCLEALAGDARLEIEAPRLAEALPDGLLARHLARIRSGRARVPAAVVAAARAGDPGARNLLLTRARWLARAIVMVQHVLHPGRLLLTCARPLGEPDQVALVQEEVARLAPRLAGPVGVAPSTLPMPTIALVGAATLVLEAFFAQDSRWVAAERRAAPRTRLLDDTA